LDALDQFLLPEAVDWRQRSMTRRPRPAPRALVVSFAIWINLYWGWLLTERDGLVVMLGLLLSLVALSTTVALLYGAASFIALI
jgi:hypothetical protein